ncbi:MAG: SDR family oxidoreductase [Sorangiineae bacterium]|nr:SDR family oxidoreductase [Polyangiaceae bacterium]MEB2323375.1 SDR family oxidoreductase [Sorangiineae bacterium]
MARRGYDDVYLVTGFPTFRGRKMVEHLIRAEPRALVYLVVREKFAAETAEALSHLSDGERARVVVIEGDAAAMDLGLSGKEYRELAAAVERIHHVAQVTYVGVDRKMAEEVNIGATREVIELGKTCTNLRSIVVHSSALVSGNRTGLVLEDELGAGQSFHSPVEETLARAERLLRSQMSELPIAVVRPTQLVGDSRTGEVDRFDGPYLMILLIVSSPQEFPLLLPARGDAPMNLVPIDYVVAAAHRIGKANDAMGRTFHLADPRPLSVRRVFELVARAGGKRLNSAHIPANVTRALLSAPGFHQLSKSPRAFLEVMTTPVRYDARNTEAILSGTSVTCPPFESYVEELVSFVKRRVAERRERSESELEVEDPLA